MIYLTVRKRRKMKKKALPFLLAGAALLAMTACSNGSATNQSETPTSSTGSVTSSVEIVGLKFMGKHKFVVENEYTKFVFRL